ncbi:MAG: hypothetical protein COW02_04115 [Comamonadaceae bacterium CG12_big_fil_rev_8_21_14_0_65_59_15]|nr:MAG: hypothetical protein COW02_04115 [Comamonadaceae bacterium CG12_big_fil_rev_8_21_14_0_65_59_15]
MTTMIKTLCAASVLALFGSVALAKLPAPSDEAKAKADEAKAKAAWTGKVGAYKLCLAQDRVVAHYKKTPVAKPAAKGAAPAPGVCADPGPFVYAPTAVTAAAAAAPAAPAAVAAAKKP